MIKLHHENSTRERVGKGGIRKSTLERMTKKHQKKVDFIFANKGKPGYAFTTLPDDKKLVADIRKFVAAQKKQKWENVVVLGIGGSALGLIALKEALLDDFTQSPRLIVLDNVDPTITARTMANVKLSKTLFVVISKSGGTAEPMALYGIAKEALMKGVKDWRKHFVFITDAKRGLLRPIAKQEKITAFTIPDKIGGRFSVLTSVGLVPAALCGISVIKLLKGAKDMQERIKKTQGTENPALLLACLQYEMDRRKGKPMTVLMPYSNLLFRMGDWYRQLLAESIGKNKKTGPTPINALGTTDQHSQVQLYMEGPMDKWIVFMRVMKHSADPSTGSHLPEEIGFLNHKRLSAVLDAALQGTSEALANSGRPNLTIDIPKIDEENLGALFVLLEFQVVLLGLLYKVNAFDQPGVESGKVLTKKILSES